MQTSVYAAEAIDAQLELTRLKCHVVHWPHDPLVEDGAGVLRKERYVEQRRNLSYPLEQLEA